jgi:hypothetical protein
MEERGSGLAQPRVRRLSTDRIVVLDALAFEGSLNPLLERVTFGVTSMQLGPLRVLNFAAFSLVLYWGCSRIRWHEIQSAVFSGFIGRLSLPVFAWSTDGTRANVPIRAGRGGCARSTPLERGCRRCGAPRWRGRRSLDGCRWVVARVPLLAGYAIAGCCRVASVRIGVSRGLLRVGGSSGMTTCRLRLPRECPVEVVVARNGCLGRPAPSSVPVRP